MRSSEASAGSKPVRGFTLIELLVVIAIIGVLSSVVLASLNTTRLRAADARVRSDFNSIRLALQLYYDKNGVFPPNKTPCCGYPSLNNDFLSELSAEGFISAVPRPPNSSYIYYYYNYGANNEIGAVLVTNLVTQPPSTTGVAGSCRPWAPNANWCDTTSNTYYCICNPH